jgi:hypothetical protein
MFKKIISTTSLFLAFAGAVIANPHMPHKFYAGAAAGYVYLVPYGQAAESGAGESSSINLNKRSGGIEGKIFGGFDFFHEKLQLGSDVFVSINNAHTRKVLVDPDMPVATRTNTISQRYAMGLYGNAGGALTETISLLGKIGLMNSRFVIKHQPSLAANYSSKAQYANLWGISPGFEIRKELTENWRLHFEGTFTFYESWKSKDFDGAAGSSATVKICPRVLSFAVGISRKF